MGKTYSLFSVIKSFSSHSKIQNTVSLSEYHSIDGVLRNYDSTVCLGSLRRPTIPQVHEAQAQHLPALQGNRLSPCALCCAASPGALYMFRHDNIAIT